MVRKKIKKRVKKRVARKKVVKKRVTKKRAVKKRIAKKRVVKKAPRRKPQAKKPKENIIGTVTHYFPHVKAGVIKLKAPLSVGDTIRIKGHTTDFIQRINSLQIDRESIISAKRGQEIGLLVDYRVRHNDIAYKV
jgi:hypothetical protein